jgi:hypothetical protein
MEQTRALKYYTKTVLMVVLSPRERIRGEGERRTDSLPVSVNNHPHLEQEIQYLFTPQNPLYQQFIYWLTHHMKMIQKFWYLRLLASLMLVSGFGISGPTQAAVKGDIIFKTNFDSPDALKGWGAVDSVKTKLVPGVKGSKAVQILCEPGTAAYMIHLRLSLGQFEGMKLRCRAMIKADNVVKPPYPYNGIKYMLHMISSEDEQWSQKSDLYGTFDWKPIEFTVLVPKGIKTADLMLGLEKTSGQVTFDDIEISVLSVPRARPNAPPTGPVYKGHNLTRLRGTMIGPRMNESDLRTLGGEWKANHIRWQLIWGGFPHSPADKGDLAAYDQWINGELAKLDQMLPICRELGMLVLIDLHTPPGGRNQAKECPLFHEKRFQDKFQEVWEKIARRYRGNKTVWGYDLVNEPVEGSVKDGCLDWQQLAERTAKAVRSIDPDHAIIIEPAPWGGPDAIKNLAPINVPGIVYSVHMYMPHQFTHQGVYDAPTGIVYPGMIGKRMWDKEALRQALQPVREFQQDYNAHIYIGEFSAIRWAPGNSAYVYLRDVINIMEEYGWDWAYHAYREWSGWSVEHGSNPKDNQPSPTPTDRQKLLQDWFKKNERAGAQK